MLGFDALNRQSLNALPVDGAQLLLPTPFTDADTFFTATVNRGAVTLTPGLYSDPDTFYSPQINLTIYPALFTDGDTFYSPTLNLTIYPSLYSDTDAFYSATVTRGAVSLFPDLYADPDTFYSPLIGIGIVPPLYVDPDIFYPPFVGLGTPQQRYPYANISQRSGFKQSPDRLTREWSGFMVALDELDPRHPQELVRPVSDRQRVPVPRPERADVFLAVNEVTAADL